MLSQQELSDRFEIQDLVFHYAHLIDSKRFDALREDVFTADAHIDYSAMGGSVGDQRTVSQYAAPQRECSGAIAGRRGDRASDVL